MNKDAARDELILQMAGAVSLCLVACTVAIRASDDHRVDDALTNLKRAASTFRDSLKT